ncbi:unnamed protein product [Schistosoma mattheei]|uniref:Band 7 domain-containing protein n=1 Tax=Schistosoma mattheei TaxID=31246 RepID=A0A183Q388_9TREM|nr:unnamed protein product [Schistosoma mattheei]
MVWLCSFHRSSERHHQHKLHMRFTACSVHLHVDWFLLTLNNDKFKGSKNQSTSWCTEQAVKHIWRNWNTPLLSEVCADDVVQKNDESFIMTLLNCTVLTRDSVTVAVDAVVYYRIYNPVVAITNVEDADRSTRLLAATTLRNVLGTKNLSEILSERDTISGMMQVSFICILLLNECYFMKYTIEVNLQG